MTQMKTRSRIAAVALLAGMVSTTGQAQPKTRDEVRGEAASAAKAGQIDHGEVTKIASAPSSKARADVKAETRAAVRSGAIDHGEVTTDAGIKAPPTKTRAQVNSEAASAIRAQSTPPTDEPSTRAAKSTAAASKPAKADDAASKPSKTDDAPAKK